jgi:hypothetical protein
VYDPNHILLDLPKAAPEEKLFAKLEKILKIENQNLRNKIFHRFYVKWKYYPKDEASCKREVDSRKDYSNFVIEDNDF